MTQFANKPYVDVIIINIMSREGIQLKWKILNEDLMMTKDMSNEKK